MGRDGVEGRRSREDEPTQELIVGDAADLDRSLYDLEVDAPRSLLRRPASMMSILPRIGYDLDDAATHPYQPTVLEQLCAEAREVTDPDQPLFISGVRSVPEAALPEIYGLDDELARFELRPLPALSALGRAPSEHPPASSEPPPAPTESPGPIQLSEPTELIEPPASTEPSWRAERSGPAEISALSALPGLRARPELGAPVAAPPIEPGGVGARRQIWVTLGLGFTAILLLAAAALAYLS